MPQSQGSAILSVLGGLFLFLVVLLLAWLCSRWLGAKFGTGAAGGKSIEVLERMAAGPDRAVLILRAGGKVFLVGSTSRHFDLIGELDAAEFEDRPGPAEHTPAPFAAALQSALKTWTPAKKQEKEHTDD